MYLGLMFGLQFYLEGLHRTKLVAIFTGLGIVLAVLLVLLTPSLPLTIQRALAFLPLQIDQQVQQTADQSLEWRLEMWRAVLPQVPQYLLVGKGYAVSSLDFNLLTETMRPFAPLPASSKNQFFAIAGAYHNGPLSVVMTFGLWGVITWVWFLAAGFWVLYRNYRYGIRRCKKQTCFVCGFCFAHRLFPHDIGQIDMDVTMFGGWLALALP